MGLDKKGGVSDTPELMSGSKEMSLMEKASLMEIIKNDRGEELRCLLKRGLNPDDIIEKSARKRAFRLLSLAVEEDSVECVDELITAGAETNYAEGVDGLRLMHLAALGNGEMVKRLLMWGLRVDVVDEFGQTPLHFAGSAEVVRLLVGAGADISKEADSGQTPLMRMVSFWSWTLELIPVIEELVFAGSDPRAKSKMKGRSAIDEANRIRENQMAVDVLERALSNCEKRKLDGMVCGENIKTARCKGI